jgi:hypothetical protein
MDDTTRTHLNNLWSADRDVQNEAYFAIMQATHPSIGHTKYGMMR